MSQDVTGVANVSFAVFKLFSFEHLLIICHDCKTRLARIAQKSTKLALFPCYIKWLVKKQP